MLTASDRTEIRLLDEAATALAPGYAHVKALRRDGRTLWMPPAVELKVQFQYLATHIATVTSSLGGLVLETTPRERVAAILRAANVGAWVSARFAPIYYRMYGATERKTIETLTGKGLAPTERQQIAARILGEGGKRLGLLDIEKDTRDSIYAILKTAKETGLSYTQAGELIQEMVPKGRFVNKGATYRAKFIARNEIAHAQRISSIEVYRKTAVVKECIAYDGDHDSECAERNGERMSFDEAEYQASKTHPGCVLAFGPIA